jgi:hypothetical protein
MRVTQLLPTCIISFNPENNPPARRIAGFAVLEEENVGLACAPKLPLLQMSPMSVSSVILLWESPGALSEELLRRDGLKPKKM